MPSGNDFESANSHAGAQEQNTGPKIEEVD